MEAVSSLVRARELLIEFMDQQLEEVEMDFGEYDLLAVIDMGGTMPLGKIRENARRYFNHQTSATNVVQRLVDRGLVSMRRDRNDGRVTLASLTPLGARRLRRAHEILAGFEFGLEGLSKTEQRQLNDLLYKVRIARGDVREVPDQAP
jgi:DNA-binding MarR family transcriptional regulator